MPKVPDVHVLDVRERAIRIRFVLSGRPFSVWIPRAIIQRDSGIPPTVGGNMVGTLSVQERGWAAKLAELGLAPEEMTPVVATAVATDSVVRVDLRPTSPPSWITAPLPVMGPPPFPIWRPNWPKAPRTHGQDPPLSEQQGAGLERLMDGILNAQRRAQLVVGSAGTGKTRLIRALAERVEAEGRTFSILTPTGRAAVRAREVTGRAARTIHGAIYKGILNQEEKYTDASGATKTRFRPVFHTPQAPCGPGDVVGVDEISMVGTRVYNDLVRAVEEANGHIVCFGDKGQIEPVKDTWGAPFDSPDVELTEVFRQAADNPIIQLATAIRYNRAFTPDPSDPRIRIWADTGVLWNPAAWYAERLRTEGPDLDLMMLVYSNDLRRRFNAQVRWFLGYFPGPLASWDADRMLVPGEKVIVRSNNYYRGWMNGDGLDVARVEPDEEDANIRRVYFVDQGEKYARVPLGLMGADQGAFGMFTQNAMERLRHAMGPQAFTAYKRDGYIPPHLQEEADRVFSLTLLDYGYARTIHLAQGSQAREVALLADGPTLAKLNGGGAGRRLAYTAVTRAEEIYHLFTGIRV